MRDPCSIIWRTVVCAAVVPGCRHEAAKPEEPVVEEEQEEDEVEEYWGVSEDEVPDPDPGCGYHDVSLERGIPLGNGEDGVIHVKITSEPAGALVEVDGNDMPKGTTPFSFELPVKMFSRGIVVSLAGYDTAVGTIEQADDRDHEIHFTLDDEATAARRPACPEDENEHWDIGFVVS